MASFTEQRAFVESLHLTAGQHWRGSCHFCGGANTLSASNMHGQLLWNCYRASCYVYGISRGTLSKHEIAKLLYAKEDMEFPANWSIPDWFQHVADTGSNSVMMDWLTRYHLWEMSRRQQLTIMYDPKMNRVVLIKNLNGKPLIAIGWSLNTDIKPKWYKYTPFCTAPFVIDPGSDVGVIVEDVPSAATVAAAGLAGISLMGTTFKDTYTVHVTKYKLLIIALDKDASEKSLDLQKQLKLFVPTAIKRLDTDLKYFSPSCIVKELALPTVYKLMKENKV